MDSIIGFFNDVVNFLNGMPDASDSYWERIVMWVIITYLEAKLYMLEISYEIAGSIIQSIGLSAAINSAWSNVPGDVFSVLAYLKIPEAINMLISAFITRFVMDLMP